ncbi:MAG: hypothetical protein P8107_01735 [Spirochaetia bacterium]
MNRRCFFAMILCLFLVPAAVIAQSAPEFDIRPDWIGLTVGLYYKGITLFPEVDTILSADLGASYDWFGYYRTPAGKPYDGTLPGYDPETAPVNTRTSFKFSAGISQGLLWNEQGMHNLLSFLIRYRLLYYYNYNDKDTAQLVFDSSLSDRERQLQNSMLVGLTWDDIDQTNPHQIPAGTSAELSLEYGPGWLGNGAVGKADFYRVNFSARAFLPLFDIAPDSELNVLSGYLGVFVAADYAGGAYIPLNILESVGGLEPRKGLGYAVRGLEDCRYNTPLKLVGNLDLRINLPALGTKDIMPGLIAFFDCGYYDFIDWGDRGFICSTGGGVYLSLFQSLSLTFTTQYLLNATRVTGDKWTPLFFSFIFHF